MSHMDHEPARGDDPHVLSYASARENKGSNFKQLFTCDVRHLPAYARRLTTGIPGCVLAMAFVASIVAVCASLAAASTAPTDYASVSHAFMIAVPCTIVNTVISCLVSLSVLHISTLRQWARAGGVLVLTAIQWWMMLVIADIHVRF